MIDFATNKLLLLPLYILRRLVDSDAPVSDVVQDYRVDADCFVSAREVTQVCAKACFTPTLSHLSFLSGEDLCFVFPSFVKATL